MQSGNDIYTIYVILQQKKFIKKLFRKCNNKAVKLCQNQNADFLRFLFRENYLKTKKDLELVLRLHVKCFDKNICIVIL